MGQLQVEVRGLDVYDPTTGEIRNSSTDDIACWFIDTAYNGESFFVRHGYFTGADEPYDKLKRALKAEIDEAAWSSLYSTTSRPFARPETGKIAVKVINHYGDEVLKVYECSAAADRGPPIWIADRLWKRSESISRTRAAGMRPGECVPRTR
jgi:adenine-specific DNA-methyltransferase